MRKNSEKGQAILLIVLAMGIFLVGALGLAIDGAQLYAHRQMAQAAADAAAQAGILSIFNGTNTGTNTFGSAAHTCTTTDPITPCAYARKNGFGESADDAVHIDFPSAATIGLDPASLATGSTPNILRVTITRSVHSGLIRMLGAAASTPIKVNAAAAILSVVSPTPLLITHPTLDHSLSTNGTTTIQICGGPNQSVQVNSSSPLAYASPTAGGMIDLTKAGPNDPGNCTTGTGADFGTFGGAVTQPGSVAVGTTGEYIQPSSPIQDPLRNVPAPGAPGGPPIPAPPILPPQDVPFGTDGCNDPDNCIEYYPGRYVGGLTVNNTAKGLLFRPGLYYIQGGGFTLKNVDGGGGPANNYSAMCTTCPPDPDTGMGMVVYDTGPAGSTLGNNPSGGFDINTNVRATLLGSTLTTTNSDGEIVPAGPYYQILFWEDRDADAHINPPLAPPGALRGHTLGQGNGCFSLVGTIYATNWLAVMDPALGGDPNHYQQVTYNGNPCSNTIESGYIIVSSLQIVGTTAIRMKLIPYGYMNVRQVALVH